MKAYTDIQQSKNLQEILSKESADMLYIPSNTDDNGNFMYTAVFKDEFIIDKDPDNIQCWSLTSLLNIMPNSILSNNIIDKKWYIILYLDNECYVSKFYDNPIDACYELIIKKYCKINLC